MRYRVWSGLPCSSRSRILGGVRKTQMLHIRKVTFSIWTCWNIWRGARTYNAESCRIPKTLSSRFESLCTCQPLGLRWFGPCGSGAAKRGAINPSSSKVQFERSTLTWRQKDEAGVSFSEANHVGFMQSSYYSSLYVAAMFFTCQLAIDWPEGQLAAWTTLVVFACHQSCPDCCKELVPQMQKDLKSSLCNREELSLQTACLSGSFDESSFCPLCVGFSA